MRVSKKGGDAGAEGSGQQRFTQSPNQNEGQRDQHKGRDHVNRRDPEDVGTDRDLSGGWKEGLPERAAVRGILSEVPLR